MANLLKISLFILSLNLLCACSHTVSNKDETENVKGSYEELYLDKIDLDVNPDKTIQINEQNWKTIKSNLIKIHYHILKLQSIIDQKNK